ncbi:FtsX-like permease family protein [Anaerolentibacter hominis]|uniref:FtsX-like permease family protein n=1 Tax=Anaerolentibacter hominis TaxID=3079009 RepID=UPI0031B8ADDB
MGAAKRAFLYLTRKRSKSIVLFLLLLVLMILAVSAVSIGNAAKDAAANLRRTLGGYFKLEDNPEYSGKREVITDSLIECIIGTGGIKSCNRMNLEYLLVPDLTLEAGRFAAEGDEKAQLARFLGNSDSSLHEYFLLRSFDLIEGRHLKPDDRGKAIISRELAQLNGLTVGDRISAELYVENLNGDGSTAGSGYVWEIVGIFAANTVQEGGMTAECDMVNNFIFADMESMMHVQIDRNADNAGKYRQASFFAEDPEQLDAILSRVYKTAGVNWESFEFNVNDKAYQNAVAPLQRLGSYTGLFLAVILGVGIALLSLILTMWMRDRMQETGMFLSMGIKKISLIGQHMLEVLVILLLALAVSFPAADAVSNAAGNRFLEVMPREEADREEKHLEMFYEPVDLTEAYNADVVEVTVSMAEFITVSFFGVLVSLTAAGIASVFIMRLKPKDILSAMS